MWSLSALSALLLASTAAASPAVGDPHCEAKAYRWNDGCNGDVSSLDNGYDWGKATLGTCYAFRDANWNYKDIYSVRFDGVNCDKASFKVDLYYSNWDCTGGHDHKSGDNGCYNRGGKSIKSFKAYCSWGA